MSDNQQSGHTGSNKSQTVVLAGNLIVALLLLSLLIEAFDTRIGMLWVVQCLGVLVLWGILLSHQSHPRLRKRHATRSVPLASPSLWHESEERYQTIIERNADGIVIVDYEGVVRYVNPAAETLFHRSRDELVGEMFGFPVVNEIAEIELIRSHEKRTVWAEMRVVDVVQQGEQVYIASLRDVTTRKKTEQVLEHRTHTLQMLHGFATEISSELEKSVVLARVVEQAVSLLHAEGGLIFMYHPDETVLRLVSSYNAQDNGALVAQQKSALIGEVFASRESHITRIETLAHSPDHAVPAASLGTPNAENSPSEDVRPSLLATPLSWHGRSVGVLVVFDTERYESFNAEDIQIAELFAAQSIVAIKNAELHKSVREYALDLEREVLRQIAEIRSQREQLAAVLDNIDNAVILTDLSARVTYVNRALTKLLDYPVAEIQRQPLGRIAAELEDRVHRQVQEQTMWSGELIIPDLGGASRIMDVVVVPVFNVEDVIESIVVSLRDISSLRQLDRMKTSFMHHISHELRTPLSNIMMSTYLLKSTDSEGIRARHIDALDHQARRLKSLTEKVLDVVRLADADASSDRDLVSLVDIVNQVTIRFQAVALDRQVSLRFQLPADGSWQIYGDAHWVARALSELVENGINYTEAGGAIHLQLDRRMEPDTGPYFSLTIRDTGKGIDSEEIKSITNDLHRGHAFLSGTLPGLGLGLTIARTVIEQHNGRLDVISEGLPGHGSVFTVILPAAPTEE